jgi:hypothetical protein
MRCHKCFRTTNVVHLTAEHFYACDLCYFARKRVLAKIKANKERRRKKAEGITNLYKFNRFPIIR